MKTPKGLSGDNTDKVMLLSMWAHELQNVGTRKTFVAAGMGKPTFPINLVIVKAMLKYWGDLLEKVAEASMMDEFSYNLAIGYADPRGDPEALATMAEAMTRWYKVEIKPEHILFTVGGAGALRSIFETFNAMHGDEKYRVITPIPHYSLYSDNKQHLLHPIDVMSSPGYQLTAEALKESIEQAYRLAESDHRVPRVVLLCNPSNPLGSVITEIELKKIANVLRAYPELTLVIDEAYAEMCYGEPVPSILKIAPDLTNIIILRSATKGLSAAGERMAMLMTPNPVLKQALLDKTIGMIGHVPVSSQRAYAYAMSKLAPEDLSKLKAHYQPKVEYVFERLKAMGAAMPDSRYEVTSTFYVLADFSELFGMKIPEDAKKALGPEVDAIKTSEELAYYLMFTESIMLAPGQYFGLSPKLGYLRITCSETQAELKELMDRLEGVLCLRRQHKCQELIKIIEKKRYFRPIVPLLEAGTVPLLESGIESGSGSETESELEFESLEFLNCLELKAKLLYLEQTMDKMNKKEQSRAIEFKHSTFFSRSKEKRSASSGDIPKSLRTGGATLVTDDSNSQRVKPLATDSHQKRMKLQVGDPLISSDSDSDDSMTEVVPATAAEYRVF